MGGLIDRAFGRVLRPVLDVGTRFVELSRQDRQGVAYWLFFQVRAQVWAVIHPIRYRGYRRAGLLTPFTALMVSRILTVDQVEQLGRLGWDGTALYQLAFHPRRRLDQTPRFSVPRNRWQWDAEQLIRWNRARPGHSAFYRNSASLPFLTRPSSTDLALEYLYAASDLTPEEVAALVGFMLPYPVYLELDAVVLDRKLLGPQTVGRSRTERAARIVDLLWVCGPAQPGKLDWWEVPGWLSVRAETSNSVIEQIVEFAAEPLMHRIEAPSGRRRPQRVLSREQIDQRLRAWHPYNIQAGPAGPHAALWCAAGFGPDEAIRLQAGGQAPDAETLTTMAALLTDPD
jgi:hypothetical protein